MGRSYVVKGVNPPKFWAPKQGDIIYIEGVRTRLGKPHHGEGNTLFPFHPPVHGTTAMGVRNIIQVARIPADAA